MRARKHFIAAIAAIAMSSAAAATGDMDVSFNATGVVTIIGCGQPPCPFHPTAMVPQSDGRIAIAGTVDFSLVPSPDGSPSSTIAFTRLLANGENDRSLIFPGPDVYFPSGHRTFGAAEALAIQPDGKYIIAGRYTTVQSSNVTPNLVVFRLNPDGNVDQTFGIGGFAQIVMASITKVGGVALQSDGSILVTFASPGFNGPASRNLWIARYTPNGVLDSSYFVSGIRSLGGTIVTTTPRIVVLPDNRVIAATSGRLAGFLSNFTQVYRFAVNGDDDPSYGNRDPSGAIGFVDFQNPIVESLALQPDGKVVMVDGGTTVTRLTAGGALDASFGTGGHVILGDPARLHVHTIAIQPDGRIMLGGNAVDALGVPSDPMFIRLHADGSLDPSVRGTGMATGVTLGGSVEVDVFAQQQDSNVLLASSAASSVERLLGGDEMLVHFYQSILNRAPDAGGLVFWSSEATRLSVLGADPREVYYVMATYFFNSAEYLAAGKSDTQFVSDLYNTFFSRAPDLGGLDFWRGQISSGIPRNVVMLYFMFSPEYQAFTTNVFGNTAARPEVNLVMDLFRGALNRLPDTPAFNFWVGQLKAAQCQGAAAVYDAVNAISYQFFLGPEYLGRARDNTAFVSDLYNAFLRRGGEASGVQFWVSQLNTGAQDRNALRAAFIGTPEFNARVNAVVAAGCAP